MSGTSGETAAVHHHPEPCEEHSEGWLAVSRDAKRSASRGRLGALHQGPRGRDVTRPALRRG
jgi:hypothetical protein